VVLGSGAGHVRGECAGLMRGLAWLKCNKRSIDGCFQTVLVGKAHGYCTLLYRHVIPAYAGIFFKTHAARFPLVQE
jgi:hypothetical protein